MEQYIKLMLSENDISASLQPLLLTGLNSLLAAALRAGLGFIFPAVVNTESSE